MRIRDIERPVSARGGMPKDTFHSVLKELGITKTSDMVYHIAGMRVEEDRVTYVVYEIPREIASELKKIPIESHDEYWRIMLSVTSEDSLRSFSTPGTTMQHGWKDFVERDGITLDPQ